MARPTLADDVCVNGACVGGSAKPCPSQDPGHIGYCEEMSGG